MNQDRVFLLGDQNETNQENRVYNTVVSLEQNFRLNHIATIISKNLDNCFRKYQ